MLSILAITGFVGLALAAFTAAILAILEERREPSAEARLSVLVSARTDVIERNWLRAASWHERLESVAHILGRGTTLVRRFLAVFEQADIPLTLPIFLAITLGLAFAVGVSLPICLQDARMLPVGFVVGGGLPLFWLFRRRQQRLRQFSIQLPEALNLISRVIRSGQSLNSAMRAVTEELLPPISSEFQRVGDAVALGKTLEAALEDMLLRVPSEDLRFFVTAVAIQTQTGGNLAEVLDKIANCVRERYRIEGHVMALTGEGRISGYVLMALPIATFLGMLVVNPRYTDPLFEDPVGQQLMQISIVLQIVGALVIQKIVKIDV